MCSKVSCGPTCQATDRGVAELSMNSCSTPADTNARAVMTIPSDMRNSVLQEPVHRVMHGYSSCTHDDNHSVIYSSSHSTSLGDCHARAWGTYQLKRWHEYAHQDVF